jgi:hypothetical protein
MDCRSDRTDGGRGQEFRSAGEQSEDFSCQLNRKRRLVGDISADVCDALRQAARFGPAGLALATMKLGQLEMDHELMSSLAGRLMEMRSQVLRDLLVMDNESFEPTTQNEWIGWLEVIFTALGRVFRSSLPDPVSGNVKDKAIIKLVSMLGLLAARIMRLLWEVFGGKIGFLIIPPATKHGRSGSFFTSEELLSLDLSNLAVSELCHSPLQYEPEMMMVEHPDHKTLHLVLTAKCEVCEGVGFSSSQRIVYGPHRDELADNSADDDMHPDFTENPTQPNESPPLPDPITSNVKLVDFEQTHVIDQVCEPERKLENWIKLLLEYVCQTSNRRVVVDYLHQTMRVLGIEAQLSVGSDYEGVRSDEQKGSESQV